MSFLVPVGRYQDRFPFPRPVGASSLSNSSLRIRNHGFPFKQPNRATQTTYKQSRYASEAFRDFQLCAYDASTCADIHFPVLRVFRIVTTARNSRWFGTDRPSYAFPVFSYKVEIRSNAATGTRPDGGARAPRYPLPFLPDPSVAGGSRREPPTHAAWGVSVTGNVARMPRLRAACPLWRCFEFRFCRK